MNFWSRTVHTTAKPHQPTSGGDEATSAAIERLRREHDQWRRQAMALLRTNIAFVSALNALALKGSQVIAEARGLEPSERRQLLDLFASLHHPEDIAVPTYQSAAINSKDAP